MTNKTGNVNYRYEVTEADAGRLRQLVAETGFFSEAEVAVAEELVQERLSKGDASGYHFVVAEVGDRLVGYTCYGEIACTVGSYDLFWIVVAKEAQGNGIGRQLLDETEKIVRQMKGRHMYAETSGREQYTPTRKFYERCGYEIASVFPDFYLPGDDKFVFRKIL